MQKTFHMLQKWQNFVKSGHTGREVPTYLCQLEKETKYSTNLFVVRWWPERTWNIAKRLCVSVWPDG